MIYWYPFIIGYIYSPVRLQQWFGTVLWDTPPHGSPPCSFCRRQTHSQSVCHTPPSWCHQVRQAPPHSQVRDTGVPRSSAGIPQHHTGDTAHTKTQTRLT